MSFGYGSSDSSSSSRSFPMFSRPYFGQMMKKIGKPAMNTFGQQLKSELSSGQNVADRGVGMDEMRKTVSGQYADPASNPYLASVIQSIQSKGMEGFNRALDQSNSMAARAGQLYSTRANLAGQETARRYGEDMSGQIGQLLAGNYQQERQRQLAMVPQLLKQSDRPMDVAMDIASILRGLSTSRANSSSISVSGSVGG